MSKTKDFVRKRLESFFDNAIFYLFGSSLITWAVPKIFIFVSDFLEMSTINEIVGYCVLFIMAFLSLYALTNFARTKRKTRRDKNNQEASVSPQTKTDELVYRLGIDIQTFESQFESIRFGSIDEMFEQYTEARKTLNMILDKHLPQSNMIFENAREIRDIILEITEKFNFYGSILDGWVEVWDLYEETRELGNSLDENTKILFGTGKESIKIQVESLIEKLINQLRQER